MARRDPLRSLERRLDRALKKQVRDGLATVFTELRCKGVASQIRKGIDVTGNVEFGIKHCVHPKIGPRVNVETMKFTRMTRKAKTLESKFVKTANLMLEQGGFKKLSPKLIPMLRKQDREFERTIRARRKK